MSEAKELVIRDDFVLESTGEHRLPMRGEYYREYDGIYKAHSDFMHNTWPIYRVVSPHELLSRLKAAEQRATDIETRTAVKLAEFAKLTDIIDAECKRLGIDWHGSASTTLKAVIEAAGVKPGDVCYRPTGETRPPKNGEWYQFRNSETIDNAVSDWNDVVENHRKIYRRLESPANQIADAEKMVEPSPAPAEEPERGSLRSELERLAGSLESGDCTRKWASKFLWTIIEDLDGIYSTSPTTIREQAAEIERLKAALTTVARACGVESGSPSAEFLVSVIEGWKQLVTAYRDAEEPAGRQSEAKGER